MGNGKRCDRAEIRLGSKFWAIEWAVVVKGTTGVMFFAVMERLEKGGKCAKVAVGVVEGTNTEMARESKATDDGGSSHTSGGCGGEGIANSLKKP